MDAWGYLLAPLPPELSAMKFALLLLALISLTHQIQLSHADFSVTEHLFVTHGITDNWKKYTNKGVYVDVDYSDIGLEQAPFDVHTFLTCKTGCWKLVGQSSIYNLSKNGFRVYLRSASNEKISPKLLKKWKVVLNWEIKANRPTN